jgi:Ca-activated chloride channel homolog
MPSFSDPWFLLLLPLAGMVGWWRWRRKQPALRVSDARLLTSLPSGRAPFVRRFETFAYAAATFCLIIALSGPRWPLPTPITTEGIAVALVVDVSGSMYELDFEWDGKPSTRIRAVQEVFQLFVLGGAAPNGQSFPGRPQDLIGLVTFASYPDTVAPLTTSHGVLLKLLMQEPPRQPDEGQTNIGDSIAEGLTCLESAGSRRKVMVLMTDGEHNYAGPANAPTWKPRLAAQRAKDLGVPIYAIDAGSDGPTADPVARTAARESLKEVAGITGGEYFAANDAASLLRVCQAIDRLERRPIDTSRFRRFREIHSPFGLAAFGLIVAGGLLTATVGRRLP